MQELNHRKNNKTVSKLGTAILMVGIIVLFSTLGGAYMASNRSLQINLPALFYLNILILLVSSVFLHVAWKQTDVQKSKRLLLLGISLGGVFLISQVLGWKQLFEQGIHVAGSGQKASYLYLMSGLHAMHILGGISFLGFVYLRFMSQGRKYLESAAFFWHFLGLLWVYLICLLKI